LPIALRGSASNEVASATTSLPCAFPRQDICTHGHCAPNLHAHVAAAIPNLRHLEYFHDHHRIEHLLFDGVLPPDGGALRPDQRPPGVGLEFKRRDAERYRVG
jgi:L-alanine-DL-glutamate epimerase-like enolase superfamily enzyme